MSQKSKIDKSDEQIQQDILNLYQRQLAALVLQGKIARNELAQIDRIRSDFGYPDYIGRDIIDKFCHRNLGARIISKLVDPCWKRPPVILDGDKDDTPFMKDFQNLDTHLAQTPTGDFMETMRIFDKTCQKGRYGGLFIELSGDLDGGVDDHSTDTASRARVFSDITSMRSYSNKDKGSSNGIAVMTSVGLNISSYSLHYDVKDGSATLASISHPNIHGSRVVHYASDSGDGLVGSPPIYQCVESLIDLFNVKGSIVAYAQAMNKTLISLKPDWVLPADETSIQSHENIEQQIKLMNKGFMNSLYLEGYDISRLSGQFPDPSSIWEVIKYTLSAASGIPAEVLWSNEPHAPIGSSAQRWAALVADRQNDICTRMIKKVLLHLVNIKVLTPPTNKIVVKDWPAIWEPNQLEQTEDNLKKSQIIKNLTDSTMPIRGALIFLGYTDEQIAEFMAY